MGFFGLTSRGLSAPFTIHACHISFWVLARPWYTLFGYRYFFDVGLRITPTANLRRLRIVFPFDSEKETLVDLSKQIIDPDFSPLIFGRPVEIFGDRIRYNGSNLGQGKIEDRVIAVSPINSTPELETSEAPGFSVWRIELEDVAQPNQTIYVRFRLPVRDPWRIWAYKGWGYAKRGVITDLRIADVRESMLLGNGRAEADHIVPIEHLFAFLVAPASFVPVHTSPSLHYSRLLEPKVWQNYLGNGSNFDGSVKFSIHQWRSDGSGTDKATPVDVNRPFRAYMDLSREFGTELFVYYMVGILLAPLLIRMFGFLWDLALRFFS